MDETKKERLKIVFMGTPDFAASILRALSLCDEVELLAVYSQPDRPCGRGQSCQPSSVKLTALELDLPVLQPLNFKDPQDVATLAAFAPDVLVVAAYGLILPQEVLNIPKLDAINVHASLLPKYRGAAPVQRCILAGDSVTGISIMSMAKELDSGDILLQRALRIAPDETSGQVLEQLADLGGKLLCEALHRLILGSLGRIPQDHELATYAKKIEKSEGLLDFTLTAQQVHNKLRAFTPAPGAFFFLKFADSANPLRVVAYPGSIGGPLEPGVVPGALLGLMDNKLAFACADKLYFFEKLKPAGRKEVGAQAFFCGYLSKCANLPECAPDCL